MSLHVSEKLRLLVTRRAQNRCEYCLLPERCSTVPLEIDHIVARKHRGATTSANLALACVVCNNLKGTDIGSVDPQTRRLVRLFNPRKDKWSRHFRLVGPQIVPLTARGRATALLLQFNYSNFIAQRRAFIAMGMYP